MKKLIFFLAFLVAIPVLLLAQVFPGDTTTVVHTPGSLEEIVQDPVLWFKQLGYVVGLVIFLTGLLIKLFKVGSEVKWPKLVLAFVVAVVIGVFTNLINWGIFADSPWLNTILGGLGIGAVAGRLVDISTMKIILNILFNILQFKKPTM